MRVYFLHPTPSIIDTEFQQLMILLSSLIIDDSDDGGLPSLPRECLILKFVSGVKPGVVHLRRSMRNLDQLPLSVNI